MFAYKLYFLLNISDFSLFFMWKWQPPWKKSPPFSQQPLSKRWDLVKPPNFENLVGGSTCPAEKGVHIMRASHTYHQELVFVMICLREWTIWTIPEDLFQKMKIGFSNQLHLVIYEREHIFENQAINNFTSFCNLIGMRQCKTKVLG